MTSTERAIEQARSVSQKMSSGTSWGYSGQFAQEFQGIAHELQDLQRKVQEGKSEIDRRFDQLQTSIERTTQRLYSLTTTTAVQGGQPMGDPETRQAVLDTAKAVESLAQTVKDLQKR
jgi:methyl-accepting chemotaxis protein